VRVTPAPTGALGTPPQLVWSADVYETASASFSSFQLNLFSLAVLLAIATDLWLDRRRAARARLEAADLAKLEAPRGRLRTPIH
jgi:hypothetical protein